MRLKWDYHTHTVYSHGKGTIEDNAKAAIEVGLSEISISDHGPGHVTYGIKRENIAIMREEIEELNTRYPNIKILLGIEANIINPSGTLDITDEEYKLFDIVMAGYHYGVFGENPINATKIHAGNLLFGGRGSSSEKLKSINTELIIRAVYENNIKIITHPGAKADVFMDEIAKACAKRGTWMEINNSHPYLSAEQIRIAAKEDVTFIIGSDAHIPGKVGRFERALERIREAKLDFDRVINLEV